MLDPDYGTVSVQDGFGPKKVVTSCRCPMEVDCLLFQRNLGSSKNPVARLASLGKWKSWHNILPVCAPALITSPLSIERRIDVNSLGSPRGPLSEIGYCHNMSAICWTPGHYALLAIDWRDRSLRQKYLRYRDSIGRTA